MPISIFFRKITVYKATFNICLNHWEDFHFKGEDCQVSVVPLIRSKQWEYTLPVKMKGKVSKMSFD